MTKLRMAHANEGPAHDLYSVIEREVTRNGRTVMLHEGLVDFIRVNEDARMYEQDTLNGNVREAFFNLTGLTVERFDRAYDRIHNTCPLCGNRRLESHAGYPGESFNVCTRCDHVVSTDFSLDAVM